MEEILLIVLIVLLFGLVALVCGLRFFQSFSEELRYINMEIHRTTGAERESWIRRKKRLWRSQLPFSSGKRGR